MINQKGKATIICDMAFGSTGKGLMAGYLAERDKPDTIMSAWSANAGHTNIDSTGRKFVHCMLPNGITSPNLRTVLIGPGSQLNLNQLIEEARQCRDLLQSAKVIIHPNACVIQQRHVEEEAGPMTKIGSTKKGCGAAMVEKIRRDPESKIIAKHFEHTVAIMAAEAEVPVYVGTAEEYELAIEEAERIQVEGAQGYSLGINAGFYPYVTSRECTPAQIASDTLLPLAMIGEIVGVMRTYPIRVANRYDEEGNMVGWSGPSYRDQAELSFEKIGQEVEYTTVTKLPRRIFDFSEEQCYRAMRTIRPTQILLNFYQYDTPEEAARKVEIINRAAREIGCGGVRYLGHGPAVTDVEEV